MPLAHANGTDAGEDNGIGRIERQRLLVLRQRRVELPLYAKDVAEIVVGPGVFWVDRERSLVVIDRVLQLPAGLKRQPKDRVAAGVLRIELERPLIVTYR